MDSNTPLGYFEKLLEFDKTEQKKNVFLSSWSDYGKNIATIDIEKGIVQSETLSYNEKTSIIGVSKFDDDFNREIKQEGIKAKNQLNQSIQETVLNGIEPDLYIDFQIQHLEKLLIQANLHYPNRKSIQESLLNIKSFLDDMQELKLNKEKKLYQQQFPFDLLAENKENVARELFSLLTNNISPFIACAEEDFISGFTGKKVNNKIKWLPTSKRNKYPSKTSLLYFIDQLIEQSYLPKSTINDLYKHIRYVFVDVNGNEYKNLKQTRQNMSNNPDFKTEIDQIITSLT